MTFTEEHLSNKGRIAGKVCDCISKAAREARRYSTETIPIAGRQGREARMLSEMASWADRLVEIGTPEAVESGRYDEDCLKEAGTASRFRKEMERLKGECESCPSILDLKDFLERGRKRATRRRATG